MASTHEQIIGRLQRDMTEILTKTGKFDLFIKNWLFTSIEIELDTNEFSHLEYDKRLQYLVDWGTGVADDPIMERINNG